MPHFSIKLFSLSFATEKFKKSLDEAVQTQIRNAAREFLRVASESVPVRTGFARGSLGNIGEALGQTQAGGYGDTPAQRFLKQARILRRFKFARNDPNYNISSQSLRGAAREGRSGSSELGMPIEYYRGAGGKILKTPQSGRQFGTPPQNIFQQNGFVYTFNYSVAINYFNLLDVSPSAQVASAPWQAFAKGRAAFNAYLRSAMQSKLPKIKDFFVETEISVEGGRISRKAGIIKNG